MVVVIEPYARQKVSILHSAITRLRQGQAVSKPGLATTGLWVVVLFSKFLLPACMGLRRNVSETNG